MTAPSGAFAGARLAPLLDRAGSRNVDGVLIRAGVPGVVLMENAGRGAAEAILALARARGITRAAVLVGPGNNGGDGFVVARHLHVAGITVSVFALGDPAALRGDAAVMRDAWRAVGGAVESLPSNLASPACAFEPDASPLIVDALFGTGLSRALEGTARAAIERANGVARPLAVALDIPSGLDADTGAALGDDAAVFRATHTLTFGTSKPGLHTGTGRRLTGDITVVPLGAPVPAEVIASAATFLAAPTPLGPRRSDGHKGNHGHVLVVGGSAGRTGAALLTARGAHRAGAGLVTIASRAVAAIEAKIVETMSLPLPDDATAVAKTLSEELPRFDAVVVGPGLGRDDWARAVLDVVLTHSARVVVDADALGLLAERGPRAGDAPRVLTPHPLEMARLMADARGAAAVNAERLATARAAATRFGATVVLKGAGTVIAGTDGVAVIAPYAEPTLGIAGSGDVLGGAIAARLAERDPQRHVERAALEAVMAHGRAGELVRTERGATRGALASEIADALGRALEEQSVTDWR